MRKKLNKWQIVFRYSEEYRLYNPFLRNVMIGAIKLLAIPEEGETLKKKHYKGILIDFTFFTPIIFNSKK